jgi:hypothetical protein
VVWTKNLGGMVMLDVTGMCWKWERCVAFICVGRPILYWLIDCVDEYDRLRVPCSTVFPDIKYGTSFLILDYSNMSEWF